MNSLAWVFRSNNSTYDLERTERAIPQPQELGPNEVLVNIRAVSLNYRDIIAWKNLAGRKVDGRVPASDGAGEVVAVGSEVTQWKTGDRVAGCFFQTWQDGPFDMNHHKNDLGGTLDGMLREHVVLPESGLVRIPESLDYAQSATLPCAGLTAWYALVCRGQLTAGQSVLALGTGGVSVFALQFATKIGATVVMTSSDDDKRQRAQQLGAAFTVNYREFPDWSNPIWEWSGGRGVDHVVEVGGPGTLEQSMKAVAASGHIALIGVLTGFGAPHTSLFPLLARNIRLNGIYVGPRHEFQRMNQFIDEHGIQPVIDKRFAFDDAPAAFEYVASGKHFGKVVIEL